MSNKPATRLNAAPQNRLTEEFLASVDDLGATVLRLNATIELGIDLTREREPNLLVETFCRGAQDIIGAKYAACGMTGRDGHEIAYLHTCGLPADTADLLRDAASQRSLFRWMTESGSADRRRAIGGDIRRVGLPENHPWIDSFLGVPIHGSGDTPGWLYLAEKLTGDRFTDEDERLASTLAWQAGVAYQNAHLHEENARHRITLEGQAQTLATQISERERAEQTGAQLQRQLLLAQKTEALGTLAGGVAHDINNCLVPITSLTALMLETAQAGSRDQTCLELIKEAGDRIGDLVGRILVFSRREAAVNAPIDLAAIFRESVNLLRATLPATVDLRSQVAIDHAIIEGDAGQLQQILLNLCVNAADAIGDAGGVIEISLDGIDLEQGLDAVDGRIAPGRYYRLRAADSGCGMDQATIARIFEPFYTTKEPGKGTGLGLAMVHTIVVSHSGHLRVESRPGAGTAFEIYLPTGEPPAREC